MNITASQYDDEKDRRRPTGRECAAEFLSQNGASWAARERAKKVLAQIFKTWDPPLTGSGRPVDVAQTSTVQSLVYCFGVDVLPELTPAQRNVINQGLAVYESAFGP